MIKGIIGIPDSMANRNGPLKKGSNGSFVVFLVPSGATKMDIPLFRLFTNLSILFFLLSSLRLSTQTAKVLAIKPKIGIFASSFLPKAFKGIWHAAGIAGASKNEVWLIVKI